MTDPDPMNVSRFNVDPKRLRKFLRDKTHRRFTTVSAMEALEMGEPEASTLLLDLAKENWLVYLGEIELNPRSRRNLVMCDFWAVGKMGIQFTLKDFLGRTTVSKGEALLEKAIAAAREFNSLDVSTRILAIKLFGSLARGGDAQGTIGDIDLEVVIGLRNDIPEDARKRLAEAEADKAPSSIQFPWDRDGWAYNAGIRHLRKVGKRLTVSTRTNIDDLGCEHRVVYRFDPSAGVEVPCDLALIPADPAKQNRAARQIDHEAPLPSVPEFRPWPEYEEDTGRIPGELYGFPRIREAAQYLWQRNHSAEEIADALSVYPRQIEKILSVLSITPETTPELIYAASPIDALSPFLAQQPDVKAYVSLGSGSRDGDTYVNLYKGDLRATCKASPTKLATTGAPELFHLAETLARSASLWNKRLRSKMPKIRPSLGIWLDLEKTPGMPPVASPMKNATAFGKAMNAHVEELFNAKPYAMGPYSQAPERSVGLDVDLSKETMEDIDTHFEGEFDGDLNDYFARAEERKGPLGPLRASALALRSDLLGKSGGTINHLTFFRRLHKYEPE